MMFEPFVALVAFLPLLGYVLVLAVVRVSGHALVTTGGRDLAAVMLAIAGLILIGPMELLFPKATAMLLGPWVWLPLLLLYLLIVCLLALASRPKLVVYGRTPDEVFPALLRAVQRMDESAISNESQWQIDLPRMGAHLRLDGAPGYDCVSVLAFEPMLPLAFWDTLLSELRQEIKQTSSGSRARGWVSLILSVLMIGWLMRYSFAEPVRLVDGFRDWLIR